MGTPILSAGRGAKVYQGTRGAIGAHNVQPVRPGQTANLRPAPNLSSLQRGEASPPRLPMDYRAAVSPAKLAGALNMIGQSNFGGGTGGDPNSSYPIGNINYMDNDACDNYDGDDSGTEDEDEDLDTEMETTTNAQQPNGISGTPPDEDSYSPSGKGKGPASLTDIPERTENGSESGEDEEDAQEESYIERHRAWVDVLDENLQRTRKNPADKTASGDFELEISELLTAVEDIIETSSHEGKVATETLYLDSKLFAEGIRQLQNNSLIIHTVDLRVTMAYFEKWTEQTIHQLLGVNIVSICQLDPFCFHIVVDSGKAKAHIFANSPLKMGTKMVFPLPWDTRFSTRDLKSRAVPVWLELFDVHPGLLKFGINMLMKIGPIIYAAKNTETQRINIVRGCVLMDLSKPLPEFIPIAVPEAPDRVMKQRIEYLRLPDACFNCRQRGHFARACPLDPTRRNQQNREVESPPQRSDDKGDRGSAGKQGGAKHTLETEAPRDKQPGEGSEVFRIVKRKGKPKYQTPEIKKSMKVDNRYGILEEPEEALEVQPENKDRKTEVKSRKVASTDNESHGSGSGNGGSSSSGQTATKNGSTVASSRTLLREIIDLTKQQDTTGTKEDGGTKLAGAKHQQDDREKRLSSVGAITPEDTDGHKKMKNLEGA
ncbi:hypothetical protein R1sor_000564 [Riccia sorocarpa]|uniref:CCHC-type domain-containing protein n=1 Tax=Riccia sorocarpa TaxID=122646 RepID=A0ABD3GVV1_9MARC